MRKHLPGKKHTEPTHPSAAYVFWPVWTMCAGLLLLLGFGIVRAYLAERPQKSDVALVVLDDGKDLHMDPSNLVKEQLHLFEAHALGQSAKFVVERMKDDAIHVALASCRACYRSHDRHYVKKGTMICGECDGPMSFESKGLKTIGNDCTLVGVAHTETSGDLTVLVRDVLAQVERSIRR